LSPTKNRIGNGQDWKPPYQKSNAVVEEYFTKSREQESSETRLLKGQHAGELEYPWHRSEIPVTGLTVNPPS